ncbi:MAG TPA: deoxyribodipyrimidine photo-lyase, partial [Polyangiales bacterium]|nr:deoxyribodipyrimidine photo-lyase [Polyangiales bacterium]
MSVPASRIARLNDAPANAGGHYVLYWMIAARRLHFNFALDHALDLARELERPLLVLEALRVGYAWASERIHSFVLEGMRDNSASCKKSHVHYYPYVEAKAGAGAGLLAALSEHACAVVTDDSPAFFLPRMRARAVAAVAVRFEAVDGNGLLPLSYAEGKSFVTAYSFRRFMQKNVDRALADLPSPAPLRRKLPKLSYALRTIEKRYPRAEFDDLPALVRSLP